MTSKERIYATIQDLDCDRPAVTPIFMAWAAHYVGHTYRDYYLDGEVLTTAQLAVTRDFGVDQISAISDPWREASGYGLELEYPEEGVGKPKANLIEKPQDIAKLNRLDIAACPRMQQRVDSVATMAGQLGRTHSVLGWVEGPLAEYADLRGMQETMYDLIDRPELFAQAAEIITTNAIDFALAQIQAGADMIGIGDAAASLVGADIYEQHVLAWEKKLIDAIHRAGGHVKLHICGNINAIVEAMVTTGADVIDIDWMVPLDDTRAKVGPNVTLCGNFDPVGVLLQGTPQMVADAARDCIDKGGQRFILMPGCEVPPATHLENLRAFCPGPDCQVGCLQDASPS